MAQVLGHNCFSRQVSTHILLEELGSSQLQAWRRDMYSLWKSEACPCLKVSLWTARLDHPKTEHSSQLRPGVGAPHGMKGFCALKLGMSIDIPCKQTGSNR